MHNSKLALLKLSSFLYPLGAGAAAALIGGAPAGAQPPVVPGAAAADSPFRTVHHPENLPTAEQAKGFPDRWTTEYLTSTHNALVSMDRQPSASIMKGVRWDYAQARAWPLDLPLYGSEKLTARTAQTTAAQWMGNAVGVSAANGIIYSESSDGFTYAINATTGKLIWRASPAPSTYMGQALVSDGTVYINAGTVGFNFSNVQAFAKTGKAVRGRGVAYNGIYALDASTGELKWQYLMVGDAMPTPVLADGVIYETDGEGIMHAVDAKTGKKVWENKVGGMGNMSSPAVANGIIYAGFASPDWLYAFDAKTGNVKWRATISGATNTSMGDVPVAIGDGVVVSDAVITGDKKATGAAAQDGTRMRIAAFDAESGKTLWTYTTPAGEKPPSFKGGVPMIHDGVVYVGAPSINEYMALDLKSGKKLWSWAIPDPLAARAGRGPPTYRNGELFITTNDSIYKLDARTGRQKGAKKLGGTMALGNALIIGGTAYFGNGADWVHAVPLSEVGPSSPQ